MTRRMLVLIPALIAALAAPAVAFAQHDAAGPQNLLALGRQQFDNLHYEEAIQTLSAAIIRRGNTPQTEIQIYELLALSYQALNRNDEAEGAYRLVLARDPNHQLSSDIAPRIIEFFSGVKQRWEAEGRPGIPRQNEPQTTAAPEAVTIDHHSPPQQQRNHEVPLTATVTDPGHRVAHLVLAFRQGSHGLFRRIDAEDAGNGSYRATIPADVVRPPLVEYYFEAVGSNAVPVQARGDAYAPLRVAVPEGGGLPWWVFVGGGAVLVGAAAIIIGVVVTQSQPATLNVTVTGH